MTSKTRAAAEERFSKSQRLEKKKAFVVKLRANNMMIKDISKVTGVNFYTVSYWLKKDREAGSEKAKFIDQKSKFQIVVINSLKLKLVDGKAWRWSESEWVSTTTAAAVIRSQMAEDRLNGQVKFWYEKRDL